MLDRDVFARVPEVDPSESTRTREYDLTLADLLDALRDVINRANTAGAQEIVLEQISLRDQVCAVIELLREKRELIFDQLFPRDSTRLQVLVTFLAVLELVRNRMIRIRQENVFGPILTSLAVGPDEPLPEALEHV